MKRGDLPTAERIRSGDAAALARMMTEIGREEPTALRLLDEVGKDRGTARRVVLTGPPGVGKSSLLREILRRLRERGDSVAVIACDPVSPYTRGAFLGDRVRWSELGADSGIFVRSLAHRGGMLSRVVWRHVELLEAAGYPWVFIETVGAGQSEVTEVEGDSIRIVVLSPGSGDELQMLKAGLLEAGDLFVVNKVDLPGGARWARQLKETLELDRTGRPPVVSAVANTGEGVAELIDILDGWRRREA